jgi:hypothetical protein
MSPEQARGSAHLDQRCDLWALATILYEAASGELPVEGTDTDRILQNVCAGRMIPVRSRCGDLPEALDTFFAQAFAEDVGARFSTAAELVRAFEEALGTSTVLGGDDWPGVDSAQSSVLDRYARARAGEEGAPRRARRTVARFLAGVSLLLLVAVGIAARTLLARPATPKLPASPAPPPSTAHVDDTPAESAVPVRAAAIALTGASNSSKGAPTAVPVTAMPRARPRPAPGVRSGQASPGAAASTAMRTVDKSEVF